MLPPLQFVPILKRIRWGGRRLETLLEKSIGPETDYAESWELADHQDGQSRVADGRFAGTTLSELIQSHGPELFGRFAVQTQFPLLIKFLDANDWLSLQVHPDDRLARHYSLSENGKTEAWVIIDALPDSRICAGLKTDVTAHDLRNRLQSGGIEDLLHIIPVTAGDCFFIPAGTVHAIGPGIVLAEVQQQSNLTFRLHDWGRVDSAGNPRPVHVEDSLICTDFQRGPVFPAEPRNMTDEWHSFEELIRCEYFVIHRHRSTDPFPLNVDRTVAQRFRILMSLEGHGFVKSQSGIARISRGTTILLPASAQDVHVVPHGSLTLLEIFQPD